MTRTFTCAAVILAGAITSTSVMAGENSIKSTLKAQGYSDVVIARLNTTELRLIGIAMNAGSDSYARRRVKTLVRKYSR